MRTINHRPTVKPGSRRDAGFSLPELLVVTAIIIILSAVAVPHVLAGRRAANEASAAQSVRVIIQSQQQYRETHGHYAATLAELGASRMIDEHLAAGFKGSYGFRLQRPDPRSFVISACPGGGWFWAGTRRLAAVEDGQLRADTNNLGTHFTHATANAAPPYSPN